MSLSDDQNRVANLQHHNSVLRKPCAPSDRRSPSSVDVFRGERLLELLIYVFWTPKRADCEKQFHTIPALNASVYRPRFFSLWARKQDDFEKRLEFT